MNASDLFSGRKKKIAADEIERVTQAIIAGKLDNRVNTKGFNDSAILFGDSINQMLDAIVYPLNVAAYYVDNISKGNIPAKITDKYKGDFNTLKNNLNACIDIINQQTAVTKSLAAGDFSIQVELRSENDEQAKSLIQIANVLKSLQSEMQRLTVASNDGLLSERGRPAQFPGGYAEVINSVNQMLDATLLPIGEGNRILSLIRGGDLRQKIEIACKGDHDKMKQSVNGVHGWLSDLIAYVTKISNGDLTAEMVKASEQDQIHEFLVLLKNNIQALVTDANVLAVAAVEGRLATRADATKHQGDFRKIVEGVNTTLDAVITPLNVAADYVDNISKGAIPAKITDSYNGDFNILKNNLNTCIDAVNTLVADADMLAVAAVEGRLATRADATKHQGDFRKIVEGVNTTLEAVIAPLNVAADYVDNISKGAIPAKITDSYNGDFNILKNNLNTCIDAVNALLTDANLLVVSSIEGRLATRADATKHQGDFRKIIEGVNAMLDALITPLNVAADYVDNISKGAIPAKITDSYNGDFNILKNNLNTCIDAVNALVADADMLAIAAFEGKLATRADATKHQGDFRKIVEGVNATLDGVILPVNEAVAVLTEMEKGNLTGTINGHYKGQLKDFKDTVNNTITKIAEIISEVNSAASNIASASEQVSATAQNMSQATSEQAASVEQTSSAVEQMSASINQNTENAKVTDGMATEASSDAIRGGDAVSKTVSAMKSIAGKIGIIDDIAYQTNLLALNAAIEAARAGEHGKGFAVVAAEVRNLAERSQVAAKEIGELAESSVEMAENAGKLLDTIVPSIKKTADLVQEIAAASGEQSTGVGQINTAMNQLNQITQQNASSSEQLAATSEEMSGQAMQLQELMAFFTINSYESVAKKHPTSKPKPKGKKEAATHHHDEFNEDEFVKF